MKATSQIFHRHLLVAIIAIVCAITPIQTQALSLSQLQTGLLIWLLSYRSYTTIQAPYRSFSVGDTFNTFNDPYRTYSPFNSYSSFNTNSSCGWTNLFASGAFLPVDTWRKLANNVGPVLAMRKPKP